MQIQLPWAIIFIWMYIIILIYIITEGYYIGLMDRLIIN